MELLNGIMERRSIRRFEDKPVEKETVLEIIGAAAYAPSWKNKQIARYIFLDDKDRMKRIAEDCTLGFTYNTGTISHAPAVILVTYRTGRSGFEKDGSFTTPKGEGYEMFDAGIATQTLCLAAQAKGLGTCIMGIFDENKVAEVVEIPEGQKLAALVAIGYPAESPEAPARKAPEELVTFA